MLNSIGKKEEDLCLRFTIYGRIPSKKNSHRIAMIGGKRIVATDQKYRAWEKNAALTLKAQALSQRMKHDDKAFVVNIIFYFPDNRRTDLSNKTESIMDALVKADIISDDSWQVVTFLNLSSAGVDKENPRAIIEIMKCK